MGQAAVDLPDPLEQPAQPASGNADDLLSQLVGDEIDRLLADADVTRPGGTGPAPAAAPTPAATPAPAAPTPTDLDASGHPPVAAPPASEEAAPAPSGDAQGDVSSQLDDLFAELTKEEPAKAEASAPAPSASAGPRPARARRCIAGDSAHPIASAGRTRRNAERRLWFADR